MLMAFQSHSQNTLTKDRVRTIITEDGDTLVQMHYEDARILLEDLLHYEYADSLLAVYEVRDSLSTRTILLQKKVLMTMGIEKSNLETMISNLEEMLTNKDTEVELLEDTIKQQKKEIRKQKFLKIIGFAGAVILPILVLLAVG